MTLDRVRLAALADYLAAAAVASLPWSTSATSILAPLWAVAAAATLDGQALRRIAATPAAVLPVALFVLGLAGTLWSDVVWPERLASLSSFVKLLAIPLLFMQFSRSGRSEMVFAAFLASACVLLAASWLLVLFPEHLWPVQTPGVPARDYIIQSGEFALCSFVLLDRAIARWEKERAKSALLAGLALAFLGNIVFVALGRTSVVVIVVLYGLLALRHFRGRSLAAFVAAGVAVAAIAWTASPYMRSRVTHLSVEIEGSHIDPNESSAGLRLGFWKMSLKAIEEAPLLGHGTGSITPVFARIAAVDPAAPHDATNPHNQILATAVQVGLFGVVLLLAMWAAHLRLVLLPGPTAWIGLSVLVQNAVGSLFNSHLFDFSQGWLYVFGIGIAGGVMLSKPAFKSSPSKDEATASPAPAPAAGCPAG
jgi:O-antigen ligase